MNVFAMYLPQYHCIPENDAFWGKGFTDWVTVKKAKPLFNGHWQPRIPLGDNYYDLSEIKNIRWQARIAREYGVSGFGIYHYWFNNDTNILTKPAEIIKDHEDIDIDYFFAWDNGNWKRSWSNVQGNDWAPLMEDSTQKTSGPQILIPYVLGGKPDWKNHFEYLLTFFRDSRYLRIDGKPVFVIYNYSPQIKLMADYWDELAQKSGLAGVCVIYRNIERGKFIRKTIIPESEFRYNYEPIFTGWNSPTLFQRVRNRLYKEMGVRPQKGIRRLNYDKVWNDILQNAAKKYNEKNIFHGGFVSYDDTPRRGVRGTIIEGASPEKFNRYFSKLIEISEKQGKQYIFLTAWNEWGEGAYMEPDTRLKYKYLEALHDAQK